MERPIKRIGRAGLLIMLIPLVFWGCASERITTLTNPAIASVKVERIAVMPFFKGRHPTNVRDTIKCALCNLSFDPKKVAIGAEETLTRYVYQALKARFGERLIPLERAAQVYRMIPKDERRDTPITLARRVGEALGANLVVLGTVWRYQHREGSPAGASRPASVAFDLYLVEVKSGELLWMANYDETQRSLSENIFEAAAFFRRGAKWLSANELARFGAMETIKKLPL
jgi:hypothetical protein